MRQYNEAPSLHLTSDEGARRLRALRVRSAADAADHGRTIPAPPNPARPHEVPRFDYSDAHVRVRNRRGAAKLHTCACGAVAEEWAFQGDEDGALFQRGSGYYSPDPDDYAPRCRPCHREK